MSIIKGNKQGLGRPGRERSEKEKSSRFGSFYRANYSMSHIENGFLCVCVCVCVCALAKLRRGH